MSDKLTESENVLLGTCAAFIEAVILQPTLYWKNAKAQRMPFSIDPRIIYRGTSASIFNEMQMMGIQFGMTSLLKRSFSFNENSSNLSSSSSAAASNRKGVLDMLSASGGGAITAIFVSPVELVMIQQQRFGGSFFSVPMKIVKEHGLLSRGLMRGLFPTVCRDSIYVTGMLGVTPVVQAHLVSKYSLNNDLAGLYASIIGGVMAALPSHPLDLVKTCMQGDLCQAKYSTFGATLKAIWAEGGFVRMSSGGFWRTVNITATIVIANYCTTNLAPVIFPSKFR